MAKKHIVEILIETDKQINNLIAKLENDELNDNKVIINRVNELIRQLDGVVEQLED